jgi:hypothetical protein
MFESRYTASETASLKPKVGPTKPCPPRKTRPAANHPATAANNAGAHPPYQTTNATALNIVASGNAPPIHGVNAARTRMATAMARIAIPNLEMVEEGVGIKNKGRAPLCPSLNC